MNSLKLCGLLAITALFLIANVHVASGRRRSRLRGSGALYRRLNGRDGGGEEAGHPLEVAGVITQVDGEYVMQIPSVTVPKIELPAIYLPAVTIPSLNIGGGSVPEIVLPDISIPPIDLGSLTLPDISTSGETIDAVFEGFLKILAPLILPTSLSHLAGAILPTVVGAAEGPVAEGGVDLAVYLIEAADNFLPAVINGVFSGMFSLIVHAIFPELDLSEFITGALPVFLTEMLAATVDLMPGIVGEVVG